MMRHDLPVVGIIGNNGIWALEYHPMRFLYGYEVVASLRPATRYDEVVKALGGHGELVRHPSELRLALGRVFASGKPALVNVLTDPEVVYPKGLFLAQGTTGDGRCRSLTATLTTDSWFKLRRIDGRLPRCP